MLILKHRGLAVLKNCLKVKASLKIVREFVSSKFLLNFTREFGIVKNCARGGIFKTFSMITSPQKLSEI